VYIRKGATRSDSTRGKKQVLHPMFEPEACQKQVYCVEESICGIVGPFLRPPQSFGAPIVIRCPRNCAPLPLLVTLLCMLSLHLFKVFNRVLHTTVRGPSPTCEAIALGRKTHFANNEKIIYLRKMC